MAKTFFLLVSNAYYGGQIIHAFSESPMKYQGGLQPSGLQKDKRLYFLQVTNEWFAKEVPIIGVFRDPGVYGWELSSEKTDGSVPISELLHGRQVFGGM